MPETQGLSFDPWARKISCRRKWQPIPVSLSGKCHGQRSLMGYSPRSSKSWTQLSTYMQKQLKRIWILDTWTIWHWGFLCRRKVTRADPRGTPTSWAPYSTRYYTRQVAVSPPSFAPLGEMGTVRIPASLRCCKDCLPICVKHLAHSRCCFVPCT